MIHKRMLIAGAGALAFSLAVTAASAQDWKQQYPELVYAVVPAENASGIGDRMNPFLAYLARELGVKVTLRIASDYAAVIEAQRAGSIHIAYYGPSSYVRAWTVTNGGVEVFNTTINSDGSIGYYAVAYAKAGAAGNKLQDFKGGNLCLVDPNSTSGNNVPRFAMDKMGIDPDTYFAKVVYAGTHENTVVAVAQGTCDLAFNWWNSEEDSNLSRMVNKKMVKHEDFKIVFKSDLIAGSPNAYLAAMPAELKTAIAKAFIEAPQKAPEAFARMSDGKDRGFHPVTHKDYEPVVALQRFVDRLRRKSGS